MNSLSNVAQTDDLFFMKWDRLQMFGRVASWANPCNINTRLVKYTPLSSSYVWTNTV